MSTCNQLDLESLGSWPTMPKNFSGTRVEAMIKDNRQLVTNEAVEFEK